MSVGITDPALAQNAASGREIQDKQRQIDAMRRELNSGNGKDKKEKLREACEGFEAIFIQKMWEQMRASVPETGLLKSKDEKIWQGMYDQELSKKMAGAGGIGLADMMMSQLGKNLEEVTSKTLNTTLAARREAFPIAPAPLLIDPLQPEEPAPQSAPKPDDMYSGEAPAVAETPAESKETEQEQLPPEFDALIGKIQEEMSQPVITRTRVITNASSVDSFDTIKGKGKRKNVPRVVIENRIPPTPVAEPGPNVSPTSVSEARTAGVDIAQPRRGG